MLTVLALTGVYMSGACITFGVLSTTDYMTRKFTGNKKRDVALIGFGTIGWFLFWPYQFMK